MKTLLLITFLIIVSIGVSGQSITYDDFKTVIPFLQKEDFKGAYERTTELLKVSKDEEADFVPIVRYMNIFSAAGMVSVGQMTHDDFSKNVKKHIGKQVVMAAHPCVDSTARSYNALQFVKNNGETKGMVIEANSKATSILCFQYFKFAEPVNQKELIGRNVRCGGILESIEVNPNRSTIWIARIHISDAFARVSSPR